MCLLIVRDGAGRRAGGLAAQPNQGGASVANVYDYGLYYYE